MSRDAEIDAKGEFRFGWVRHRIFREKPGGHGGIGRRIVFSHVRVHGIESRKKDPSQENSLRLYCTLV
jgi:hypothetical protein